MAMIGVAAIFRRLTDPRSNLTLEAGMDWTGGGEMGRKHVVLTMLSMTIALCLTACPARERGPQPAFGPRTGAWSLADGRIVAIAPSSDGALRWRTLDGRTARLEGDGASETATTGWSTEADAIPLTFGDGARGLISFDRQTATRLELDVVETRFESRGETLAGRLVLPRGGLAAPILVEVHGSERSSALTYNPMQQLGPASGVGVFVYDKRGTGGSTGAYTQDFSVLAQDGAAAVREARRLAGTRAGRVGLHGGSQGGWVAPLAAGLTPVDFVIVGFGLAESPLEENRAETIQDVAEAGFDADAQRKAGELADAAGVVIASRYRSGYAELDRLRRLYGDEPWYAHATGEFTGELARYPSWTIRLVGPSRDVGTSWNHQSEPPLRALDAPLLWMLAGADRSAPPERTRALLTRLIGEGRHITLADFPDTDHGITNFRPGANGERVQTGYASGYFTMILDFALDRPLAAGAYGNAVLTGASTRGRPPE